VVIPATNRPPTLDGCLAAIAAADDPPDEIVVVSEPGGSGPAAARNDGVRQTRAEVVIFIDSDVLVHRDVFARTRHAFAADPGLAGLFGSYDHSVATNGTVAAFRNLLHHTVHQRSAGEVHSFWAGIGAVRREAFEAAGAFDSDRYPHPSIEDIELGGRLSREGRIVLDPALQGTHLKEWSLESMIRTDLNHRGIPWVSLLVEQGKVPAHLNLGARERASVVAALMIAWGLARRRPFVTAAGIGVEVALNLDLLSLLYERRGARGAIAGIALHTVHHLTAVAAVPAGLVAAGKGAMRR
jgi:GT2 family glycosyltransferase